MKKILWRSFEPSKGHQWWHTWTDMFWRRRSRHNKGGRSFDLTVKIRKNSWWRQNQTRSQTRDVEKI